MTSASNGYSIGRLADETGVAAGTLRMWEARHAFPTSTRQAGTHRRYSADDVARIRMVLADRERGLSLAAAIARAREWTPDASRSLFATLRAQQPHVVPARLTLSAMRSLSHAIEDECLACAERPIVAGGFQTVRAYRRAEPRWRELARTSRLTFVLAGFRRRRAPAHGPLEVPVAPDEPARREWVVVCLDNRYTACLAGWELPDTGERRRFEVAWTTEPVAVVTTMKRAVTLAGLAAPGERGGQALAAFAEPPPANADMTLRLSNRMIGYLATSAGER